MKRKLEVTCNELHNLYLNYKYPVLFVSPKLVLEMRGIQYASKIAFKKAIFFLKKSISNRLWNRLPFISRYLCRDNLRWLDSLKMENRFDFEVFCCHGQQKTFTKSNQKSSLKKRPIVVPKNSNIPVVIYGFARPNHLRKLLSSIENSKDYNRFHFVFFLDGPRNPTEIALVKEVHDVCLRFPATHKTIISSEFNVGLHDSVVRGLDAVFQSYEFAVVLEDDLECDPKALSWFEEQSHNLTEERRQGGLCGYFPPMLKQFTERTFECGRFHSWGWATWRNVWNEIDFTDQRLLELVVSRVSREKIFLTGPDILPIAIAQIAGDIDSWAVKFTFSAITSDQKFIFPGSSLIKNNGYGKESTHTGVRRDNIKKDFGKCRMPESIGSLLRAYYA